mmetsp:Transcript_39365/g.65310  ORF Transcript_39365/g.65310 Transcript_39365/m.65310 type:complete len:184 (-) Transcript_39365:59-610(-)
MRLALHARSAVTGGVIGAVGDAIMQWREGHSQLDWSRTTRLASFRTLHAPLVDSAWRVIDTRLLAMGGVLATGITGAITRAVCDQLLLAPPSISFFFLSQGALEGLSFTECVERVHTSFVPAYKVALPFWGCVHVVTFGVIKPDFRIAWASVIAVFWNAFMSGQNQCAKMCQAKTGVIATTGE